MGSRIPEWLLRFLIEQLARFITPEVIEQLKAKALEYLQAWGQQLPAGLGAIVVAFARAIFSGNHAEAAQAVVCWAKGQAANTANKIDDAFVDVLAHALQVDPNQCPVPAPTP